MLSVVKRNIDSYVNDLILTDNAKITYLLHENSLLTSKLRLFNKESRDYLKKQLEVYYINVSDYTFNNGMYNITFFNLKNQL